MAPKTDKEVLLKCRLDYQSGNYKGISELASRYGINDKTLWARIKRENWDKKQVETLSRIEKKVTENRENIVSEYLTSSYSRAKKYESIIDATIAQHATDVNGNPLVEISDLDSLTKSELRIHELAKSSLRIAPVSQIDVTSGGKALSASLIATIESLRSSDAKVIDIPDSVHQRLLNSDVEPDSP